MTLHASTELRQVLVEAEDIAKQTGQRFTSAHLLLSLFTVHNRAEILLKEKKIDEDTLLALVHTVEGEPPGTVRSIQQKARQIAAGCGAQAVDCLHLLIALCGARESLAYDLLRRSGLSVQRFRNTALSYVTGRLPRRLTLKRAAAVSAAPPSPARALVQDIPSVPDELRSAAEAAAHQEASHADGNEEALEDSGDSQGPAELGHWDLEPSRFPMLSKLGRNLTSLAAAGKLDPLIGRMDQIEEVIDTLLKRRANNPVLVGEPGVGKTAIVEGLALALVAQTAAAQSLGNRRIVELDVSSLLAGTQLRGAFSEKLLQIREEVKRAEGSVVVFFDEMHTLMGAGATGEGPQDAANELKASLSRGEFPCIGATTHDEYRRFIETDAAFARRLHAIQVPEPTPEETLAILKGLTSEYSQHHGVSYDTAALEAAVHLSSRYITDRCLPDKAISLLDLAGSRARRSGKARVDLEAVARVVSSQAGIPVERLLMTDAERLLNMEQILGLQIIGHTSVIRAVARVIRRNYAGFAHRRPIGSFLFLGPTGVGKTESARALAQFLFGNREALVKLDMNEYSEAHTVSRLVGSPPGYVGYQEGGQLTEAVRRKPYTIVLFDEVEKAHPEVQQILLHLLEEGRLTDSKGRTVDFTNTVVILTSNQGCEKLGRPEQARIGFGAGSGAENPELAREMLAAARRSFPPELWGRMDEQLFFRPLGQEELAAIAVLMLKESSSRIESERGITLGFEPEVARHLVEQGCLDTSLGARPLRSAVRRMVEEPLAEAILAGKFHKGDRILLRISKQQLVFGNSRV